MLDVCSSVYLRKTAAHQRRQLMLTRSPLSSAMLLYLLLLSWSELICGKSLKNTLLTAEFTLIDEVKVGQVIGNIRQALWPQSIMSFSLIAVTSSRFQRFNEYFSIAKNGSIVTQKHVDRDDVNDICGPLDCCQSPLCTIQAKVMLIIEQTEDSAVGRHNQMMANLHIHLSDINDNAPKFPLNSLGQPQFTIRIQEGAKFAREVLPSAVDLDSARNGIVQYRIETKGPLLELLRLSYEKVLVNPMNETQGWRLSPPALIQLQEFDYENPNDRQFELIVLAVDGGDPELTGTLSVTVVVLDINDNTPVFQKFNIASIELAENTTFAPIPVFQFAATDMDSDENRLITYSLSPLNDLKVFEKFSIESQTGALYLKSVLDYEVYSERSFTVIAVASDNGTPRRSGTTTLTVITKDINDNLPSLVVQENITVIEGINYTKPVVRFYVKDDDSVSRGKIICRPAPRTIKTTGSASLRLQEVTTNAYFVFTEGIFDYEETQSAHVDIVCSDNADSSSVLERVLTITVAIGDANDHYPEFGVTEFLAKLAEHSPIGTAVTQITATDADSSIHARLTYSIVGSNGAGGRCSIQEMLSIDSVSGVVTVQSSSCLDREIHEEIEVFVAAVDGGGLSTSVKLKIQLVDVNDNDPVIQVPDQLSVSENLSAGVVVGRVRCTDVDTGPNADILLELSENNTQEVRSAFDIIPESAAIRSQVAHRGRAKGSKDTTGLLITKEPLDREEIETYTINFVAMDSGTPRRVVQKTVELIVLDENDNSPTLKFPQPDTTVGYHPQIYTNSPHGSKVCVLRSFDPDRGENGTVMYALQQNTNGSRYFHLDQTTGKLTTAWHKKGPSAGLYALKVLLYDMGRSPAKVAWNFYVHISPRNPLLDPDQATKSNSSRLAAGNSTFSFQPGIRLAQITTTMICVAVAIVIVLFISCFCMVKVLFRPQNKEEEQNMPQDLVADSVMKESSASMYSPPNPSRIYTQATPLLNNGLGGDNITYALSTPDHSGWYMKPLGQNESEPPMNQKVTILDRSVGGIGPLNQPQTFARSGYATLWQNYPIS